MTKRDFLKQLKKRLRLLPWQEREKLIAYYSELIEDEVEEGRRETEAVSRRGNIDMIAEQTLRDYISEQCGAPGDKKVKLRSGGFGIRLAIAIVSFPVWLPLYLSGWSVLISLYVSALSCVAAGVLYVAPAAFMLASEGAAGGVQLGCSIAAVGAGILLGMGAWELTKLWLNMSKWLCRGIRYSFRKEAEAV